MYIYSCFLYDNDYEYVLSDHSYTNVWAMLAGRPPYPGPGYWEHLSSELKKRIPYEILDTPSSIGLAKLGWRNEDRKGAFAWFKHIHGRIPNKLAQ